MKRIYSPAAESALEAACTLADFLDREVSEIEMIVASLEAIAPYLHHDCQQLMAIAKDIEETCKLALKTITQVEHTNA